MSGAGKNGEYYAEGLTVHKSPVERLIPIKGGHRIHIGFPVCTVSEWLDEKAAEAIANALNVADGHPTISKDAP